MPSKKTHNDHRRSICILCFKKCKPSTCTTFTDHQRELVEEHVINGLDPFDERLPTAICTHCRLCLSQYEKGQGNLDEFKMKIFDYSKLTLLPPLTRTSPSCQCFVCEVGRTTLKCTNVTLQEDPCPKLKII